MTQNQRILATLSRGLPLTETIARRKLKVQNLSARIHELRQNGNSIYNNNGNYRLGTPSKAIVAAGYEALGGKVFSR